MTPFSGWIQFISKKRNDKLARILQSYLSTMRILYFYHVESDMFVSTLSIHFFPGDLVPKLFVLCCSWRSRNANQIFCSSGQFKLIFNKNTLCCWGWFNKHVCYHNHWQSVSTQLFDIYIKEFLSTSLSQWNITTFLKHLYWKYF